MTRFRLLIALGVGLTAAAAAPAPAPPFRIAVKTVAAGQCSAALSGLAADEAAYFRHLAVRLDRPVLRCPVANAREAAASLAAGAVDMAVLDVVTYGQTQDAARAILTARSPGALTRVPVILAVQSTTDPSVLKGQTIVFSGKTPAAYDLPKTVLAEQGFDQGFFGAELIARDEKDALDQLRAGHATAVAIHVGAWQRLCRGDTPKESHCSDLKVVWRARPRAETAWSVRRDMERRLRYRLVGVHVALHLENKPAFSWAAAQLAPGAEDLEAAEALALTTAHLK